MSIMWPSVFEHHKPFVCFNELWAVIFVFLGYAIFSLGGGSKK